MSERATLLAMAIPLLALPGMGLVFRVAAQFLSREAAYLLGFTVYWLGCCLLPWIILGKQVFLTLLRDESALFRRKNWLAALVWLLVMVISVWMYGKEFVQAPLVLIAAAIPLATVNGVCEEVLWRGLFVRLFPGDTRMSILYPAIGFALWHFAPQIVYPAENAVGFVVSTFFLGLAYGFIAYRTGSAKWTTIAHSLGGVLALSGWLAPSVLAMLKIG
ncbi:MAG: CPBP family intramembrane glutamic endopeptidase [Chloroflexota bacterium]